MGLLDEAIREHLELKRRRGADPSAVAREEHEALALAEDNDTRDDVRAESDAAPPGPYPPGSSTVGQETAEIDMQALLDEQPPVAEGVSPEGPVIVEPAADDYEPTDGVADWVLEGQPEEARSTSEHEQANGQERLSFE